MDDLLTTLQARAAETDTLAAALNPEILALQRQLAAAQTEEARLQQERDLAQEAYMSVARKAEEARIAAAGSSGEVQLASRASVPTEKVGPKRMRNTALAGAVGLMLGVVAAFGMEYFRDFRMPAAAGSRAETPEREADQQATGSTSSRVGAAGQKVA